MQEKLVVKERIQKADGSIRYRNYLKQDSLGKGIYLFIQADLPNVSKLREWKIKKPLL